MPIDFYYIPPSAPCRAVWMLSREINLPLNFIEVDLFAQEPYKPEFLDLNPCHTVPTIVDHDNNGLVLWESRAILAYLVDKYVPGHDLYPRDPTKRAIIDRWLYFDIGTLHMTQRRWTRPTVYTGCPPDPEAEATHRDTLKLMNDTMERSSSSYLAGDTVTIADLSILATISYSQVMDMDLSMYPKIVEWWNRLRTELPYYDEINGNTIKIFKEKIDEKRKTYPQQQKEHN